MSLRNPNQAADAVADGLQRITRHVHTHQDQLLVTDDIYLDYVLGLDRTPADERALLVGLIRHQVNRLQHGD